MALDLVVRNGTVVDGSGGAPFRADVGVRGGTVVEIGRITERGAVDDVDAEGLVVTPGFVDGHTHMDAQVLWDGLGSSSCWHGVTTVVMGNCGFTLAPVRRGEEHLVVGNLERAEDISATAMAAGIDWSWEQFAGYLDAVDRAPKAINYATQVGHSALRTWAMGPRAFEGPGTEDDVAEMERQLEAALGAGAFGFTTSRSINHETSAGHPVASRLADWGEVDRLVRALGRVGGVFQLAQEQAAHSNDDEEREAYHRRLRDLAADTGVTVAYGVGGTRQLGVLDEAARAGARFAGLAHSRGICVMLSFRTRLPFDRLPLWRQVRAEPLERQRALLSDPVLRSRLVEVARAGDYGTSIGADPRVPRYDEIQVLRRPLPPNPTVAEVAADRGLDPVELMIELGLESHFGQFFAQPVTSVRDDELLEVMRHPRTVMTFSDAGAHVSQIIDASIQTHLLGHWVRERQAFTLAEAVRMITAEPASVWGLAGRGLLREGSAADINVFDPARVGPAMPALVEDLPGGDIRLVQRATGFAATVVNGEVTLRDGEPSGARPGVLLRRPAA